MLYIITSYSLLGKLYITVQLQVHILFNLKGELAADIQRSN